MTHTYQKFGYKIIHIPTNQDLAYCTDLKDLTNELSRIYSCCKTYLEFRDDIKCIKLC